ncbi:hypothetical protein BPOR_0640g00070 [Botrytis porri]|uniref:Uncharacterized protein n=2 Tax=Botrytis porri TaxID=87229 RepID=A0A4Z1KDL6_9HELO|nr:hypothetical protein BPOR_0640g00070 [Botrytis porri]
MSEASVGFCNGDDSSNDRVLKAYNMCNSEKNALPNTHSTLTATLVLQSGSASIVQIAPVVTTSASDSVATTLLTTAPPATATSTPSSTTKSKSSAGVPQPAAATGAYSSPEKSKTVLSTAQIAGIVVAGVGGVVLVVGALLLFACMRRKRQANRDSGYLPFQQEPSLSIKSQSHFGITKPMAPSPASISTRGPTPIGPFLGARMPSRGGQPSPDPFSQRNAISENIGLAMTSESPQNNMLTPIGYTEEVFQRGPSPLLPERPALTLQVPFQRNPNDIHTAAYQHPSKFTGNNRQSVVTQFEDEDSCSTAVASEAPWNAASYGSISKEKVLQQPDPAHYQSPRRQGELSPNETEHIIDSYKDPSVEPDFYIRPLNLQRNFSQPHRPENAMKPSVHRDPSTKDPLRATSSVYSAKSHDRRPSSNEIEKLNSLMQSNPSFRHVLGKSAYNPVGSYDQNRTSRASIGSMTSFETMDSINPEPQELSGDTNLSPVVESPMDKSNVIGVSPVKYPKIKGNLSQRHSRTRRTRTSIITNFPAPPPISIESPIHPPTAHSKKPWQEAEIAAQKTRMASLGLSPGNFLSPGSHNSGITIRKSNDFFSPTHLASRSPPPPIPLPLPPTSRQRDMSPRTANGSGSKRNAPPPSLSLTTSLESSQKWRVLPDTNANVNITNTTTTTSSHQQTSPTVVSPHWRPQILTGILRKDSVQSLHKPTTTVSSSNNILFQPLSVPIHTSMDPEISSIYSQETRNFTFDPRLTQMTTMSEIKAQGQAPVNSSTSEGVSTATDTNTNGGSVVYTKDDGSGKTITINIDGDNPSGLPKTPGWLPTLTPTRRGNDLFLNVQ